MMKLMNKIIFIFVIIIFLTGCQNKSGANGEDEIDSPIIPALSVNLNSFSLSINDSEQIIPYIAGTEEEETVLYNSLNSEIATVNDEGLVTALSEGETDIIVYFEHYPDVSVTVQVIVRDLVAEAEREAQKKINEAIIELSELIPTETKQNILLPVFLQNYTISITWLSSDPAIITNGGIITRKKSNQFVELEAKIIYDKYNTIEGVFKKTVKVKKYELNSIENKKPVFAYLYHYAYQLRDEDLNKIDYINYSFAYVMGNKLSVAHLSGMSGIINKVHDKGVRFILSVGGWGASGFSVMASTDENRAQFIQSVISVVNRYSIDGIDLDWEYPTTGSGNDLKNPSDRKNFTSLVKELRLAMDEVDSDLILTAAFPASSYAANNYYEINKINKDLDYLHLMTYDLIDYSGYITSHHANLFSSNYSSSPNASADSAVKAYEACGADKDKITIGVAFYGHIGTVKNQSTENGMKVPSENLSNAINFSKIYNDYLYNSNYTYYFDDNAKAPWLFDGTTFITFDDSTSIHYKCKYVLEEDLGGIMFWQLGGDYHGILLNAIYESLNK